MPRPRKQLISLANTHFYHCVSRCVRRAFLCGKDHYSGQSYEHRRGWVEHRLMLASEVFAIQICSHAIMSNHYHAVLHVKPAIASSWTAYEVVERWHRLFRGTNESEKFLEGLPLVSAEMNLLKQSIEVWRRRLIDISWFMRVVNEHIARRANAEDECTGSFWEGRFKSQALLDSKALLSCMAYVDLNPIRAGIADQLATSNFTSIKLRIDSEQKRFKLPSCIDHFVGSNSKLNGIPFSQADYIQLLTWTAKSFNRAKALNVQLPSQPKLLKGSQISNESWTKLVCNFETQFGAWVGSESSVLNLYTKLEYRRCPSTTNYNELFG